MTSWFILAAAMLLQQAPQEFHQDAGYTIEAVLDSTTGVLQGRERVRYRNNAPERIDTLWFHLHLNAFRPNSKWAQRELQFNNRRFQDLGPNDHAYERVRSVIVGGRPVNVVYPLAPDSTVMGVPLPAPLNPGMSVSVDIQWTARLSTIPRRQGRKGQHYDFAQWYPRIAVYDRGGWQVQPLLPQGEFYGEFANYDVTLEVPGNFVIGATGVPVSGDPGWEKARLDPSATVEYARDAYDDTPVDKLGLLDGNPKRGNKRVHWRAQRVHHFAWSADPQYVYEGGRAGNTLVHALFLPSDTSWRGVAVERTIKAMQFLESLFGPYPYPQITNVHRIEQGGTEFPMMVMNGSAGEGLIVHEIAHQWAHGILANNEFKDGWLDEGMASFVGMLYSEAQGQTPDYTEALEGIARADMQPDAQPIATPGADFKDMRVYSVYTYTKPSLVFRMLQHMLGDSVFRAGMRKYYEDNRLQHVDEEDFKAAMEAVSGQDLDWFFQQWLHTNNTLDYAVTSATATRQADGTWRTRVEITRSGQAWMPVKLKVGDVVQTLDSRETTFSVTVDTAQQPTEVVLDPDMTLIEPDRSNNRKAVSAS